MKKASEVTQIITQTNTPEQLEVWLEAFLVDRRSAGLRPGTIRDYQDKINSFVTYCGKQSITRDGPADPRLPAQISAPAGGSTATTAAECMAFTGLCGAFLLWYEAENEPEGWRNPIKRVKAPKVPDEVIEPVEAVHRPGTGRYMQAGLLRHP